jgi:ATP-dependent DNA helicase RecQ
MADLDSARSALRTYFGFDDFREGQDDVVAAILAGEDAVVVMPTGGGKSLCYQLPALMREGPTLVVSPLIALMKDQVDALAERRIAATFVNSSVNFDEQTARIRAVRRGEYKLVYVAPERFRSERFVEALREVGVSLFAVDEAHCISHWGHDFRPDYLRLADAARRLGRPQIVALTATATAEVRADIAANLGIDSARHFIAGFDRPNLGLRVAHTSTDREKLKNVVDIVRDSSGTGIIYVATRKSVDGLVTKLKSAGVKAAGYHAGLADGARASTQDAFMAGTLDAIVATNAFGMGIDKPDIRFVIHYHMPGSIEAYYQEVGRAGRDGLAAECTLFFNYADTRFQQFFIDGAYPSPDFIAQVYQAVTRLGQGRHDISARELAERGGLKNDMAVGSALSILERAGHVARGSSGDQYASIEFSDDGVATVLAGEGGFGAHPDRVLAALAVRMPRAGKLTQVNLADIARDADLTPSLVRKALTQLETKSILTFKAVYLDRGIELADDPPAKALRVDRSDLARRAAAEQRKLRRMVDYAYHTGCLRAYILRYFGDRKRLDRCGSCSSCSGASPRRGQSASSAPDVDGGTLRIRSRASSSDFIRDAAPTGDELREHLRKKSQDRRKQAALEVHTDPESRRETSPTSAPLDDERKTTARKILACAARLKGKYGKGTLASVLRGSRAKAVVDARLDQLSTYGLLAHLTQDEIVAWCDALLDAGYLRVTPGAYPTVFLTDEGRDVMLDKSQARLNLERFGLG